MRVAAITGWILTVLLVAMLCLSAYFKLAGPPEAREEFSRLGWNWDTMFLVGIVEIVIALLFLLPRTAFLSAVLLTAYLGGAVATHARIQDNFIPPIVIGVLVWVAAGLRDPRIFRLAFLTDEHRFRQPSDPS